MNQIDETDQKDRLRQEIGRKKRVLESVSSQNDFMASRELVNAVEDLIPGVLRHQANECIQADDSLFTEMVENGDGERIGIAGRCHFLV